LLEIKIPEIFSLYNVSVFPELLNTGKTTGTESSFSEQKYY